MTLYIHRNSCMWLSHGFGFNKVENNKMNESKRKELKDIFINAYKKCSHMGSRDWKDNS
jgi:hypothetical protein